MTIGEHTTQNGPAIRPGAGRKIGRYTVLGEVGHGGTATVYEAVDTNTEQIVALKVLSPFLHLSTQQQRAMVTRLEREAEALARFAHPNVARIFEAGAVGDNPETRAHYLAMEFLRGETLRDRLDRAGLPSLSEAADIIDQAASGIDAVHRVGFIHRDIKPSNIMIVDQDLVKIMDFGIARQSDDTMVTQVGAVIGSPSYMSPEQAIGEAATEYADLWSLAVVAYEMVSGQQPFRGANIPATLYQITHSDPAPLSPSVPPTVEAVLRRALARDPAARFYSGLEFAKAFRAATQPVSARIPRPVATSTSPVLSTATVAAPSPATAAPTSRKRSGLLMASLLTVPLLFVLPWATQRLINPSPARRGVASSESRPAPSPKAASLPKSKARTTPVVKTHKAPPTTRTVAVASPAFVATPTASPTPRATPIPTATPVPTAAPSVRIVEATPTLPAPKPSPRLRPRIVRRRERTVAPPGPRRDSGGLIFGELVPSPAPEKPVESATPAPIVPLVPAPPSEPAEPARQPDPDTLEKIGGQWKGTHSGQPALLTLDLPSGPNNTVKGNLSVRTREGTVFLTITGLVAASGAVVLTEQQVIDAPGPRSWDTGTNTGILNANGIFAGTGVDRRGRRYTWTFHR